jgi:5-(carboxyamino)imidazole ribonucleotide mutase
MLTERLAPSSASINGLAVSSGRTIKRWVMVGLLQWRSCRSPEPPLTSAAPVVGVLMGSSSDWDTLQHATQILAEFGVPHEARVVSAHRMPDDMFAYAEAAAGRGLQAIIAGAGGAAHLPGMLAAKTVVPVLGVPVASRHLQGVDSLHSIVQMPKGVPVATFAIGAAGAANAALFAVAMLANRDAALRDKLLAWRARQTEAARAMTGEIG